MKALSTSAQAAKMIRKILSDKFPEIKFSVRCSRGNAIDIDYTNGVPTREIKALVSQFEYGHFDGMQDLYIYSNHHEGLPQVKFIFVNRTISEENEKTIFDLAKGYFNDLKNAVSLDGWYSELNDTPRMYLYQYIERIDFRFPLTLDIFRGSL